MSTNHAIIVEGLSKTFIATERGKGLAGAMRGLFAPKRRSIEAVRDISFFVNRGERVAFVGPNGAGKSTTIKMLSGILYPTAGNARVAGLVPWKERSQLGYRIGTVFGQRSQLWYHLPATDTFDLLSKVYELDNAAFESRRDELVRTFEVGDLISRPVRQLSLGQRMRLELVASLLHRPEVLFLDEPTIGLDVTAKAVIRDLVRQCSIQDGTAVLLTSHDTGDMERVCERVIVINDGRLLIDRPVRELRSSYIRRKVVTLLTTQESVQLEMPGVELVERAPYRAIFEVDTAITPIENVVSRALSLGGLRDVTIEDPPMEEIVKMMYAESHKL